MAASTSVNDYDDTNVFAKIIAGDMPSHKVFENRYALAILDAYPVTKGHVVLMPKRLGSKDLSEMSPRSVCDLTSCIPLLCKAIKKATGAEAINIVSNMGELAGQTVFHPHIHLIPRMKGDGLVKMAPAPKDMIEADKAQEILASIIENIEERKERPESASKGSRKAKGKGGKKERATKKETSEKKETGKKGKSEKKEGKDEAKSEKKERPRRERKGRGKATKAEIEAEIAAAPFITVGDVKPEGNGSSLAVKYVSTVPEDEQDSTERKAFSTHYFGDETGTVIVSTRRDETFDADKVYEIRNFKTLMTKGGFLRVYCDKFGKISASEEKKVGKINKDHNVSAVEYEKVD
jgi:histidine triad (HIT) family protein